MILPTINRSGGFKMPIQPGSNSRLNIVKGCNQLLVVDSSDISLLNKVFPSNMIIKDRVTGGLYLTDGIHTLAYVFANLELNREMTAAEVSSITNQVLYD